MEILSTIGKILIGLFGLGIMIFIHELGHLIAAKLLKVKVETFSLGYGKKIFGFRRGDTMYQVAWFPFGGFTKMRGEHVLARAIEQNLDRLPDDPDNYYHAPPWKRILISLAGPVFNLVFALLAFTTLYWVGFTEYSPNNRIILSSDYSSLADNRSDFPANEAGLKTGDLIISINGEKTRSFLDLQRIIATSPDQELSLTVQRGDTQFQTRVTPFLDRMNARGIIGISSYVDPVIKKIDAPTGALNPWLAPGDRILSISGSTVTNKLDIVLALKTGQESYPISIERNGQTISGTLSVPLSQEGRPEVGLTFIEQAFPTGSRNLFEAAAKGADEVWFTLDSIIKFFALIPQKINVRNAIGGPIITTLYIGEYAGAGLNISLGQGIVQFIQFICMLSVILFFMNLLPLPVLDGGFVVLFALEWIRRKPFRPRFIYYFQMIGFGLLAVLFIFVVFNDVSKLINL